MKNLQSLLIVFTVIAFVSMQACKDNDPVEPTPTDTTSNDTTNNTKITYTADAAVILNASCAVSGCHVSGAAVGSLQGYADAKSFAGFGRMMGAVNHQTGFSPMPKNGTKLSDEKIATLQSWIDDGLLE